jgi:hypothetical protein
VPWNRFEQIVNSQL